MDGKYESPQNEYDHERDHLDDGILYEFCKQTKYLEDFYPCARLRDSLDFDIEFLFLLCKAFEASTANMILTFTVLPYLHLVSYQNTLGCILLYTIF